jgi:hypothetical protein
MAWDPSRSGLLAIGVISWNNVGFVARVAGNGTVPSTLNWNQQGGQNLSQAPVSVAFGQGGVDGKVVAFGMQNGTLQLIDPTVSGAQTNTLAGTTAPGPNGAIIAVNPIPRFDGTAGGSDFAVSYQPGSVGSGVGGLLRWDGTSSGLTALPVISAPANGPPNSNTTTPDFDSFREWYPGIKEGRFQVSNTSGEPVTVAVQASPNPGFGCWYAPSWADATAFPTGGISVAAGQTSASYPMGAYTAGSDGGCAATDATGTWRGYLIITPLNHPADARLIDLRLNRNLTVDVLDQAGGGSTTVSIAYTGSHPAAYGLWNITVDTPAAPTPTGSPTVNAARVTPADFTGGPPVYRFDVTAASYQLPTPYPNQLVVPPLIVQGSVDGTTWTTLGTLIPRTEPTINGSQLTLGPATFWWENPPGQPAYQQIRVALGPTGTPSPPLTLSSLHAPTDPTNVSGPQITATGSNGIAAPVDSGLDQAPLSVQVLSENEDGSTGPPLPPTDSSYQRIYYRADNTNALITNLLLTGANPNSFLGVSPYAGAYPNNGSVTSGGPAAFDGFHYLSTTSTVDQKFTGYIAGETSPSQPIDVHATAIDPVNNTTSAATGISLAGCTDFSNNLCRLYPISPGQPALYLDTSNGVQIGLLTAAPATTSAASLPLQQTAGTAEHLLASAPLTFSSNTATLTASSTFLPTDHVDTTLVTHGVLVSVVNIPVVTS